METVIHGRLAGWQIHGFRTLQDLDVGSIFEEARTRWLRPNEIHAILCNHSCFNVIIKPLNLSKSGTIVLFDRKMLRNFRKDGYNWKKKKDGKTVKEAHEHLKVGDDERIHVYYAHGEDNPTFVRRCYWLLDKKLEHIVLVHYREIQEMPTSKAKSINLNSDSIHSNTSAPLLLSDEINSVPFWPIPEYVNNENFINHEKRLHEINTLEWEELLAKNVPEKTFASREDLGQHIHYGLDGPNIAGQAIPNVQMQDFVMLNAGDLLVSEALQTHDNFGRLMNCFISDSPGAVDNPLHQSLILDDRDSLVSPIVETYQSTISKKIFSITDVSPAWAFSTKETKILIIGFFHGEHQHYANRNLLCVCDDSQVPVEIVQVGVFRSLIPPHTPGLVNIFLSFDGRRPISQVFTFEYRTPLLQNSTIFSEDESNFLEFQIQLRLANLLFSTSNRLDILSSKVPQNVLSEARKFSHRTSHIVNSWANVIKLVEDNKLPYLEVKGKLFELALKNRLQEWLLEKIIQGGKITDRDDQGRGVIHLCTILGYTWVTRLFSLSGISLDYRDKYGWTSLHWAAYCGREKMAAALLSAGAKPNLVTDPTLECPGGYTPGDLASKNGHEGLGAYLSEKALVQHLSDMTIAGNVSGSLPIISTDNSVTRHKYNNLIQDDMYLKDTLAAYCTAADAAARIQIAFREHSLKVRRKKAEAYNTEDEARNIVAVLKIQRAFQNFEMKKKMTAATRIQYRFRSWKIRHEFINTKRQIIKIQTAFRGFQVRRHYQNLVWSVGVLEKAILRWRLKRNGFRGIRESPICTDLIQTNGSDEEEEFFKASREQAEGRVERSVKRVQSMFHSEKVQKEYRKMKLAHNQAKLDFKELLDSEF